MGTKCLVFKSKFSTSRRKLQLKYTILKQKGSIVLVNQIAFPVFTPNTPLLDHFTIDMGRYLEKILELVLGNEMRDDENEIDEYLKIYLLRCSLVIEFFARLASFTKFKI